MTSEMEQIKLSYEQLGMTPDDIATDRDLAPEAVKAALMSCSAKFRRDCVHEVEEVPEEKRQLDFSEEQLERVNEKLFSIAMGSENDAVAAKVCMYIRDDKKGRKDAIKSLGGVTFNVLQLNEMLKRSDEAVSRALGIDQSSKQITDV